jgi:transcriptional regulator of heat shock response
VNRYFFQTPRYLLHTPYYINMDRKKQILEAIIKEHIATGAPVGSSALVEKYKLDCSSATIRNIMAELEENGLIMQPHTSAGRVPTEAAYNLFIEELKKGQKKLKKMRERELHEIDDNFSGDDELALRETAKTLAALTNSAVFWAFHKNNLYYTGLSNLFQQPEFVNTGLVYNISSVIDRMDEIIDDIFEKSSEQAQIFIGEKNPFGNFCGSIIAKYKRGNQSGLFGILGPMRMDYERNLSVVEYILNKLKK